MKQNNKIESKTNGPEESWVEGDFSFFKNK